MAEYSFKVSPNFDVWNKYQDKEKVVHGVEIILVCKENGEKLEDSRKVQIITEGDDLLPEFVDFPTVGDDKAAAFEELALGWAKDVLKNEQVPDPDAEFSDQTTDQLTLWKKTLLERMTTPEPAKRRKRVSKQLRVR